MISSFGIQPVIPGKQDAWLTLQTLNDVLAYLNTDIVMRGEYAFLDRNDLDSFLLDTGSKRAQYFVNGILVSGLLDHVDDREFSMCEKSFNKFVASFLDAIKQKLAVLNLDQTHETFKVDDDGDLMIGFMKRDGDVSAEQPPPARN